MSETSVDRQKAKGMCPHGNFPGSCKSCRSEHEDVPETIRTKELVREAPAFLAGNETFVVHSTSESSEWVRPLFFQSAEHSVGSGESVLTAKVIPTMGRAAFVEQAVNFDGTDFNFLQWKGVGKNPHNVDIQQSAATIGGKVDFPLGDKGLSPMMLVSVDGRNLLRFVGASFYKNLLLEAKNQERFSQFGIRMPRIVGTVKLSRAFCQEQGLPLPDNDDPNDLSGQDFSAFLEFQKDKIDPELYQRILSASDMRKGYKSVIFGQNIRAFRNIWRAEDLERIMTAGDSEVQKEQLKTVFETSSQVLGKELGHELTNEEFAQEYARILGEQAAVFLENYIDHGSLDDLKQNITLAGEMVDFDATKVIDETFLNDENHWPSWVTSAGPKKLEYAQEWQRQKKDKLLQQIYFVASHLKPVVDGLSAIGLDGTVLSNSMSEAFVGGFKERVSKTKLLEVSVRLKEAPELGTVEGIYTGYGGTVDQRKQKNFAGCQDIFGRVSVLLNK